MLKRFSFINQIAMVMLLLTLIAISGMGISNRFVMSAQGNAHAINKSGTLRMQSYRFLANLPLHDENNRLITEFEQDLKSLSQMSPFEDIQLKSQFSGLEAYWLATLKPTLLGTNNVVEAKQQVVTFVEQIDQLVGEIDRQTEQKIRQTATIQLIFIAIMILLLIGAIVHFRRRLLHPWRKLMVMAESIGHGDFKQRFPAHQLTIDKKQDEIASLGITLNRMTTELAQLYSNLENRVEEKTLDLKAKNQVLSFLYESSQWLHTQTSVEQRLEQILIALHKIVPQGRVCIRLYEDNNANRFYETGDSIHSGDDSQIQLSWNLSDHINRYGVIFMNISHQAELSVEQQNLMLMLSKQITSMLAMEYQHEQQQQLLLMDERSAIARELHDSIAQSLSCLKMQISFLQMQSTNQPENLQPLLKEMREEVNVAYRQLRELLTTFRLKLIEPGLFAALETTVNEFNQRFGYPIDFQFELPAKAITSHQAIHIVQIVREALSNILQHANADWAQIKCWQDEHKINITVCDNGEGISAQPEKVNHYGLAIMRERAASLNGECIISRREQGGTQVHVIISSNLH